MEWFWGVTGGVIAVLLVFGALYDRRAIRKGRGTVQPREATREHQWFDGPGGSCGSAGP